MLLLLLVVFSACGGIRTGSRMPVLTAYWLRAPWERELEQVAPIYSLSVTVWPTARH